MRSVPELGTALRQGVAHIQGDGSEMKQAKARQSEAPGSPSGAAAVHRDAVPAMTEKALSKAIVSVAKECGWLVARTWLSKFSPAGEPDLRMLRNGKLLVWELKTDKGKVSPAQQEWLDAYAEVPGVDVRVVRPANLEEAYKVLLP